MVAGWPLARGLPAAIDSLESPGGDSFLQARIDTALLHAAHLLPQARAWRVAIRHSAESVHSTLLI